MNNQTVLIHKKADPTILDNYRPIALAPVIYKLWMSIITDIASNFAEKHKILSPTAEGFRKVRSTTRATLLVQLILEHAHESNK